MIDAEWREFQQRVRALMVLEECQLLTPRDNILVSGALFSSIRADWVEGNLHIYATTSYHSINGIAEDAKCIDDVFSDVRVALKCIPHKHEVWVLAVSDVRASFGHPIRYFRALYEHLSFNMLTNDLTFSGDWIGEDGNPPF